MDSTFVECTRTANLYKWGANEAFRQQFKEIKKRGRPKGSTMDFVLNSEPRTPFEALRMLLKISGVAWAKILDSSQSTVSHVERGVHIASIPLAKRMQEEARKRGVAVTLDELYQHVVPWGAEQAEESDTSK